LLILNAKKTIDKIYKRNNILLKAKFGFYVFFVFCSISLNDFSHQSKISLKLTKSKYFVKTVDVIDNI